MSEHSMFAEGTPEAKPRHRHYSVPPGGVHATQPGYVRTYVPVTKWSHTLIYQLRFGKPVQKFTGPVALTLDFYFRPPLFRRRKDGLWKVTKPDIDNLAKAVMDAINTAGNWWKDDNQVSYLVARKIFVKMAQQPVERTGVWILIRDLEDGPPRRTPT